MLAKEERECEVSALSAMEAFTWEIGPYVETLENRRSRYLEYSLFLDGRVISAGTTLFVRPKEFSFEKVNVKIEVSSDEKSEADFKITVTADGYYKSVCLSLQDYDGVFSDNWFDVHGGEPVTLWLRREGGLKGLSAMEVEKQLKIQHY